MFASDKVELEELGKVSPEPKLYPLPLPAFSNSKESTPFEPIKI